MKKRIDTTICGAICLLLGWGVATLIHECCHLAAAHSLGLEASLGALTLTTGSVFVYGDMTSTQTAIIALAGSLGLVIAGVLMVRLSGSPPVLKMIGIIFLCRAFVDAIPINDMDGALIAGSIGYLAAWALVIIEVLISGGIIFEELQRPNPLNISENNNIRNDSKNNIDKRRSG